MKIIKLLTILSLFGSITLSAQSYPNFEEVKKVKNQFGDILLHSTTGIWGHGISSCVKKTGAIVQPGDYKRFNSKELVSCIRIFAVPQMRKTMSLLFPVGTKIGGVYVTVSYGDIPRAQPGLKIGS